MKALAALSLAPALLIGQTCPTVSSRVTTAPRAKADQALGFTLAAFASPTLTNQNFTIGGDLSGAPSFGYCPPTKPFLTRPTPAATLLLLEFGPPSVLIESDSQGNIIRSITQDEINAQLSARGSQPVIDFNHEAIRLPNGFTALIAHVERLYNNVQGTSGTVDILGDEAIVLDLDWQVVWTWNAYDFLDINRKAILGETCSPSSPVNGGCPVALAATANDWLHGNSLYYDPTDGNFLISLRSQDWVIKFNYGDGAGDGHVIWRLGNQGDFAMLNTHGIANPWFSHQHDAEFETTGFPRILSLFDNQNVRAATDPTVHSRGQALLIDENAMTADVMLSVDMRAFSKCYGSAQMLPNGNFWFSGGYVPNGNARATFAQEVVPRTDGSGASVYAIFYDFSTYRTFRRSALP